MPRKTKYVPPDAPVKEGARFEVIAEVHAPNGVIPGPNAMTEAFERFLDRDPIKGIDFTVIIYTSKGPREIRSIGDDPRAEVLANTLRRSLRDGRLRFEQMGSARR